MQVGARVGEYMCRVRKVHCSPDRMPADRCLKREVGQQCDYRSRMRGRAAACLGGGMQPTLGCCTAGRLQTKRRGRTCVQGWHARQAAGLSYSTNSMPAASPPLTHTQTTASQHSPSTAVGLTPSAPSSSSTLSRGSFSSLSTITHTCGSPGSMRACVHVSLATIAISFTPSHSESSMSCCGLQVLLVPALYSLLLYKKGGVSHQSEQNLAASLPTIADPGVSFPDPSQP